MQRLTGIWSELRTRSPILAFAGLLHCVLIAIVAGFWATDSTTVMGINTWIKPMKFMVSITLGRGPRRRAWPSLP